MTTLAPEAPGRARAWRYFLLSAAFWCGFDFSKAFAPDFRRWVSFMPAVFLFYFGAPLLFSFLIYRRGWTDRQLVAPMLLVLFVVEVLFAHNALLWTFPLLVVFVPVAVGVYSFITFVPRWASEGELSKHRVGASSLTLVWLVIALLSTASRAAH